MNYMGGENMDYFTIGQRIRALRKEKKLSQQQLAEKVWISTTHMSHIENGSTKLSLPVLVDLAAALGVSTNEILSGQGKESRGEDYAQVKEILDGCTEKQLRILTEIVRSAKAALDKYQ